MRLHRTYARPGFTLIELLVVIGLILVLVGITLSISYSGLIDGHKTVGASDKASGWLLIARSKAQRDKSPQGVRFIRDTVNPNLIKEAQYIEVPDPFLPKIIDPNTKLLFLDDKGTAPETKRVFITGNVALLNALDPLAQNVVAGDTLALPDFGTIHQVVSVGPQTSITVTILGVPTAVPVREIFVGVPLLLPDLGAGATGQVSYSTTNFGFLRQARPSLGEPILLLTGDNAIDGSLCQFTPGLDASVIDIVFAPNGEVIGPTQGKTILWVRNPTFFSGLTLGSTRAQYEQSGQMSLIVVYTKTGQISTQPVALPQGLPTAVFASPTTEPYQFANDGKNSGL